MADAAVFVILAIDEIGVGVIVTAIRHETTTHRQRAECLSEKMLNRLSLL